MEKTYNPHLFEQKWYQTWEQQGYFKTQPGVEPYCIMIPPPNVTGSLHMGHAFQTTLMDILIRYHRMRGDSTLWQVGTDHAGIATQMVVERQLNAQNIRRQDLGREAFIQKIWQWKEQSGNTIVQQLRRMGASTDWSRERFTLDAGLSAAVVEVFVRLYDEGLIYRGKRLVNWDPSLQSAISDLEVVAEEEQGQLWHLRYPFATGQGHVVVATTRPETLLGDTAVAVHPDDPRYTALHGTYLLLPIAKRKIPIILDKYVDPQFGTGCVKITPAHDFNDYAMGQRHGLPMINIFTPTAQLNDNTPPTYQGLDRYVARKKMVAELHQLGLVEKIEPHKLKVPRSQRTGEVVEPYLTDQWFVKAAELAQPAIKAVEEGRIQFVPDNWKNTYYEWMHHIQDWCISRQLWWGHRIPAWYDAAGQIYVGRSEKEVRQKYQLSADMVLHQDEDVLDTWFSSALWPFSTLGWPEKTPELHQFYPTAVLVTGFDIIFFWVARMIMMGLKFMGEVPFKQVYITGLVRDSHGQKMSKSKGNVIDPIDLVNGIDLENLVKKRIGGLLQPEMGDQIEQSTRKEYPQGIPSFGTDPLRFTCAALASTGRDINFDMGRIEGYRNFCNKLWNASRYVLMNTQNQDCGIASPGEKTLSLADRWIQSRLQKTLQQVEQHLAQYRFDLFAQAMYEFIWNEYCDWYLEFCKPLLNSPHSTSEQKRGTRYTLIQVLENILRMTHPLIPYMSEEIWQHLRSITGASGKTIMLAPYPRYDAACVDEAAESETQWLMDVILSLRKIRSGMDIPPGKMIPLLVQHGNALDKTRLNDHQSTLKFLAKIDHLSWLDDHVIPPEAATALVGQLKLFIPMAGLIDKTAEVSRLEKEINKMTLELDKCRHKLSNSDFVTRAPAAILAQEKQRVTEFGSKLQELNHQLVKIKAT